MRNPSARPTSKTETCFLIQAMSGRRDSCCDGIAAEDERIFTTYPATKTRPTPIGRLLSGPSVCSRGRLHLHALKSDIWSKLVGFYRLRKEILTLARCH